MVSLNESIVEDATLTWFGRLGYAIGHGSCDMPLSGALSVGDIEYVVEEAIA